MSRKIRDRLYKVAIERGIELEPNHDPIHDQKWYMDAYSVHSNKYYKLSNSDKTILCSVGTLSGATAP